jgi:hypothetical protein
MAHKFVIGQTVYFTPAQLHGAAAGDCEIRRLMPSSGSHNVPRYRIKNIDEIHERIAFENELACSNTLVT